MDADDRPVASLKCCFLVEGIKRYSKPGYLGGGMSIWGGDYVSITDQHQSGAAKEQSLDVRRVEELHE